MKKLAFLLTVLATAVLLLSSCGSKNPAAAVNPNYLVAEFQNGLLPYQNYAGNSDTIVANGVDADTNYVGDDSDYIGKVNGTLVIRYFTKFDVGAIPTGVKIKKAYLTLLSTFTIGTATISSHAVTSAWSADALTWNNSSGVAFDAAASGTITVSSAKYYSIEISPALVQSWVDDSTTNNGVMLKSDNEAVIGSMVVDYAPNTTLTSRPKLTVYYTLP